MVSDLQTKIWFGKYKGKTIAFLLEKYPEYLIWAHKNTDTFRMTEELIIEADSRVTW